MAASGPAAPRNVPPRCMPPNQGFAIECTDNGIAWHDETGNKGASLGDDLTGWPTLIFAAGWEDRERHDGRLLPERAADQAQAVEAPNCVGLRAGPFE